MLESLTLGAGRQTGLRDCLLRFDACLLAWVVGWLAGWLDARAFNQLELTNSCTHRFLSLSG